MGKVLNYIDLFAGAGGLSEGFVRQGFRAVAHVEMNKEACDTLVTRAAYYNLKENSCIDNYWDYLKGNISKNAFLSKLPRELVNTEINSEISENSIGGIFEKIDALKKDDAIDVIIGGPPCQAYSLVGRSRDPNKMEGDKRSY